MRGSTTSARYFMWLTVAVGHRHHGIAGAGARLRIPTLAGGANLVSVVDDYFRLHWLELDCAPDAGWIGNAVVFGFPATHGEVAYVLAHDEKFDGILLADYVGATAIRNSIVYGFDRSGIVVGGPHRGEVDLLVSNTVVGNQGDGIGALRALDDGFFFEARGNLVVGNSQADFGGGAIYGDGSDNLSSDRSAPGVAPLFDQQPAALFVSTTAGAEDLHLVAGAPAVDRMTASPPGLSVDIDEQPRPTGVASDVGADEYAP